MKICIWGDAHWSQYSSIVRRRGEKYSLRLENEIKSINWVEQLATDEKCCLVVNLGDFFDKPELNSEELTALEDIEWGNMGHRFLVGNHEMGLSNLLYSSAHLFNLKGNIEVVSEPQSVITYDGTMLCYLPYTLEDNRQPLKNYFPEHKGKRVIFSHNDIKVIQMGQFISKEGFEINEIENNCDLFINGHLHNGKKESEKLINVGNLTGQNFSEDATRYDHVALILDTATMKCAVYENPYALNFYKVDMTHDNVKLPPLKNNCVFTVKCKVEDAPTIQELLNTCPNVVEHRLIVERSSVVNTQDVVQNFSVDHIQQFNEYILNNLGNNDVVLAELAEVCK